MTQKTEQNVEDWFCLDRWARLDRAEHQEVLFTSYLGVIVSYKNDMFLISNFRRVLNDVCFLLGDSPASEFYMATFQNTLSVPSS